MDLGINNSRLSFQANIVTSLRGRNNIMQPIAEEFSKMTKNIDGELLLHRAESFIGPRKDHLLEFEVGKVNIITSQFEDMLSTPPEKADKKTIKKIAREFVYLFKALRRQDKYIADSEKSVREYSSATASVNRLTHLMKEARERGHHAYADVLSVTIAKYQKQADDAAAKVGKKYDATLKAMEKSDSRIGELLYLGVPEPKDLPMYYR